MLAEVAVDQLEDERLVAIALARMEEIATVIFGASPRRLVGAPPLVPAPRDGARAWCS